MKKAAKVMALMVLAGGTAAITFMVMLKAIVEHHDQQEYQYTHYDDEQYD